LLGGTVAFVLRDFLGTSILGPFLKILKEIDDEKSIRLGGQANCVVAPSSPFCLPASAERSNDELWLIQIGENPKRCRAALATAAKLPMVASRIPRSAKMTNRKQS
jgi:hypothetical protein